MWTKSNRSRGRGGYRTEQQKMTSTRKASVPLFIAAIALGAAYAPAHAAARSNFDGNWSVLIVTSSGPCDPSYRFGLSIRNGDIFYNGSGPVNLNGRVSGNGSVRVQVSAGAQSACRVTTAEGSGVVRVVRILHRLMDCTAAVDRRVLLNRRET